MSAQYPQPPSNAPPPNEPPPPLNEPEAPPPGPSIPPPAVLPPYQPPDPKSYLDVAPSYELPSYSSGDTAARREYWNIEAPDEQIPDYVPRTSTGSATASTRRTEIDASQLAEAFRRSFRTARILAVVLAIAAVASSAAGAANAYAARSTGLWAAVGIAATGA